MHHSVTKKTVRTHQLTIIAVFTFVCAAFIVLGNIFLFVIHDARDRMIDTTVSSIPALLGTVATTDTAGTLLTVLIPQVAEDMEGLVAAHVVRETDASSTVIASLHQETSTTPLVYEPQTLITARALPEQVVRTTHNNLIYGTYVFTDTTGAVAGYVETVFDPHLFAASVHRNTVRTGVIVIGILASTMLVLFWFIGIGEHQRLLRRTTRVAHMHNEVLTRIVHEVQTPLTVISGYITMLQSAHQDLEPVTRQYIKRIKHTTTQLERFIRNISFAIDLEQRHSEKGFARSNPVPLIQQTIDSIRHVQPHTVDVSFTTSSTDMVYVDPKQLCVALEQILVNAVQHTLSGSVRVSLGTDGGDVCIRVEDFGKGMTPHEVISAKEKWYRGNLSHDALHRGSGLGLWIAERLIKNMHGKLTLESTIGVGTTVSIYLPRTLA
jgi:signal transduction histidine kinase